MLNKMVPFLLNNDYKYIKEKLHKYFDTFYHKLDTLLYQLEPALQKDIKNFFYTSKNIRSVILLLICLALDTKINKNIISICIITELIHNASIIHDDIVDDSTLRRNNITYNKKYDNKFACLLGDYMLTLAVGEMLKLKSSNIEKYFNRAINHMCIGEINQYLNKYKIITIKEYLQKCIRKTSLLFEAQIYAYCALNLKEYKKAIKLLRFARYFGIIFQMKDDLDNIIKPKDTKPVFDDIKNGIYNLNIIYALEDYPNLFNKDENEYIDIIKNQKYILKTNEMINKYKEKALQELDFLNENCYKSNIFTILNMFML